MVQDETPCHEEGHLGESMTLLMFEDQIMHVDKKFWWLHWQFDYT